MPRINKDLPIFRGLGAVGQDLNPQEYPRVLAPTVDILGTAGWRRENLIENTYAAAGVAIFVPWNPPAGKIWRVLAAGISTASIVATPYIWASLRMLTTAGVRCSVREPFQPAATNMRYPVAPFWWPNGVQMVVESDNAGHTMTFNAIYVELNLGEYVST